MKKLIFLVIVLVFCFVSSINAAELKSQQILNTGSFGCDNQERDIVWQNTSGQTMYVTKLQVWVGFDENKTGDVYFTVFRWERPPAVLGEMSEDHYEDRTSLPGNIVVWDYSPHWFEIRNNEHIDLNYSCNNWTGGANCHISVTIWWF